MTDPRSSVYTIGGRALSRRALLRTGAGAAAALLLQRAVGGLGVASAASATGPSTTVAPYLFPAIDGVGITAILSVRDKKAENGYAMVGIPDGLGLIPGGDRFTLVMTHELGDTVGVARSHGSKGAFVSRWTIDTKTLRVIEGADLTGGSNKVFSWDVDARAYRAGTTTWNRFCSADLAAPEAFLNGTKGTSARLFLTGEEANGGRGWAHIVTGPNAGESWQLPRMGRSAFENLVASPFSKDKTIVVGLDDGSVNTAPTAANNPCELFVYIGMKQDAGNDIERAGLTNGKLYGVRLPLGGGKYITEESNANALGDTAYGASARFEIVPLGPDGDVSAMSGAQLEDDAIAKNVLRMQRIEDGAWDPRPAKKNDFYFVTTGSPTQNSRLWRLSFDDLDAPERGGTLTALLKGDEGQMMLDNLCIDALGRIVLQEDPGNVARVAKVWVYGIDSKKFIEVARHDRGYFDPMFTGQKWFKTQDEESSGVIDASAALGAGWFLLTVQSHNNISATDPDLAEEGQLLAMYLPTTIGV